MKKNILLVLALFTISLAYGQYEDQNPRPIDSSDEYNGKVLNQMERVNGEGDVNPIENPRQEMQEKPDESLPGYDSPEEGYEEDVNW
jgi:hypothetical protein